MFIASLLTNAPVAVDELIRQSAATAAEVHMALLELELAGRLARHALCPLWGRTAAGVAGLSTVGRPGVSEGAEEPEH